jgi:hypothetical protein
LRRRALFGLVQSSSRTGASRQRAARIHPATLQPAFPVTGQTFIVLACQRGAARRNAELFCTNLRARGGRGAIGNPWDCTAGAAYRSCAPSVVHCAAAAAALARRGRSGWRGGVFRTDQRRSRGGAAGRRRRAGGGGEKEPLGRRPLCWPAAPSGRAGPGRYTTARTEQSSARCRRTHGRAPPSCGARLRVGTRLSVPFWWGFPS